MIDLRHGDCLDIMSTLTPHSVNLILADLPYGTTACKWDVAIPFPKLWAHYKRLLAPQGVVALFGTQPFTSVMITSNLPWFKYCWTWNKVTGKGHLVAKHRPMQQTEDIAIFGDGKINYYPIMRARDKAITGTEHKRTTIMGGKSKSYKKEYTQYYPKTLLTYGWTPGGSTHHPTQKPIDLLAYMIVTYTRPGDLVLDNTMGSGSTMVAAAKLKRRGIGIELYPLPGKPIDEKTNPDYFHIAQRRVNAVQGG